jgi:hypothetical protein
MGLLIDLITWVKFSTRLGVAIALRAHFGKSDSIGGIRKEFDENTL